MPNTVTANDMPNYRYGVRGMKIAVKGENGYGDPWIENGIETVDESGRATANSSTFYSDDGKPATVNGAVGNDTFTIQAAEFSDKFQVEVMGHSQNAETGVLVKDKDDEANVVAFGWEVQGTLGKTRIWRKDCTCTEPAASAYQTKGENVTESPETTTVTVNGKEYKCREGQPGFATFLDSVPAD